MCSCVQTIKAMQATRDRWEVLADNAVASGGDWKYPSHQSILVSNDIADVIDSHAYCVRESVE